MHTRSLLHRVAAHVLGRRRFEVSGRFGLRSSPAGIATPAFGNDPEVLRIAGMSLVRERGATQSHVTIQGCTLRELAAFAGTDLDAPFSAGDATPPIGDVDEPLALDRVQLRRITDWYSCGWEVLDEVITSMPMPDEPATIQLWPEHFDAATSVGLPNRERVNLGFSPGDGFSDEPYLYVGPWSAGRGGDPSFWNAPFGALRRISELDPSRLRQDCLEFIGAGLANASAS